MPEAAPFYNKGWSLYGDLDRILYKEKGKGLHRFSPIQDKGLDSMQPLTAAANDILASTSLASTIPTGAIMPLRPPQGNPGSPPSAPSSFLMASTEDDSLSNLTSVSRRKRKHTDTDGSSPIRTSIATSATSSAVSSSSGNKQKRARPMTAAAKARQEGNNHMGEVTSLLRSIYDSGVLAPSQAQAEPDGRVALAVNMVLKSSFSSEDKADLAIYLQSHATAVEAYLSLAQAPDTQFIWTVKVLAEIRATAGAGALGGRALGERANII